MLAQGPSQAVVSLEWDSIWAINKKVIDLVTPRFGAIETANMLKLTLNGSVSVEVKHHPQHKKNPKLESKDTLYGPDEAAACAASLSGHVGGDADAEDVDQVLDAVVESLRDGSPRDTDAEEVWREVVVPVDLPFENIISAVRICIRPPPYSDPAAGDKRRPLFAGQPVAAILSIGSSFHWHGPGTPAEGKSYSMRFDVQEKRKDWLISGRKKGDFLAVDGGTHCVPLTLVPLRHGELALPQVDVRPLALAGGERWAR